MASNESQPQQESDPRGPDAARGPLVASEANPRYFTVAGDEQKAVYLTGSHIWNNLGGDLGKRRSAQRFPPVLLTRKRSPHERGGRACTAMEAG